MDKEKQIEEMARALGKGRSQNCNDYVCCSACPCDFCCIFQENAHTLVQEGYRNSSEVAREIFEEIEEKGKVDEPIVEYYILSYSELAELKKKYTEEGK